MEKTDQSAREAENLDIEVREPRVYEVGYQILPFVGDTGIEAEVEKLKGYLTKHKGLQIAEGRPYLMDLAYPMHKVIENKKQEFTTAYFGWIKFDVSPHVLEGLKKDLDAHPTLLRYLLIKTPRENTFLSDRKFNGDRSGGRSGSRDESNSTQKKEEPKAEEKPINEAELEKKIDDLVV